MTKKIRKKIKKTQNPNRFVQKGLPKSFRTQYEMFPMIIIIFAIITTKIIFQGFYNRHRHRITIAKVYSMMVLKKKKTKKKSVSKTVTNFLEERKWKGKKENGTRSNIFLDPNSCILSLAKFEANFTMIEDAMKNFSFPYEKFFVRLL